MTAKGKLIRDKYLDKIDSLALPKGALGDCNKYISADIAKSLVIQALHDFDKMNDAPQVDFWGQPIEE